MLSIDTSWTDPNDGDMAVAWTRSFWEEMHDTNKGRVYLNFDGDAEDTEATMRASYGDASYERLVEVKTKYDPTNAFRPNKNIPPMAR